MRVAEIYTCICLFLELFASSPVSAVTLATSLGQTTTARSLLTLATDTRPTSSLSSLVSPSLKLGDDGHATHLVPKLAPPSTLTMCTSVCLCPDY